MGRLRMCREMLGVAGIDKISPHYAREALLIANSM